MDTVRFIILAILFTLTTSCTHSIDIGSDHGGKYAGFFKIDEKWLENNRKEIVNQIYAFIKKRHPTSDNNFPVIKVKYKSNKTLENILNEVAAKFSSLSETETIWELDIVSYQYQSPDGIEKMFFFPHLIVCFNTLFIVCPSRDNIYVQLNIEVTNTKTKRTASIRGYGGGARYVTSLLADKAPPEKSNIYERNSKALASAIASATDQLVLLYLNKTLTTHSSRSQKTSFFSPAELNRYA